MLRSMVALTLLALGGSFACSDDDGSDVQPNPPPGAGAGGVGGSARVEDAGPGGTGGASGGFGGDAGASATPGCRATLPDAGLDAGALDAGPDDAGFGDAGLVDAGFADGGFGEGGSSPSDRVSFAVDIHPIFEASCGPCHADLGYGGHNVAGDVDAAYADAVRLGQRLVTRINGGGMPPPTAAPPNDCGAQGRGSEPGDQGCLTVAEVALVQAWIDQCFPR